MVWRSVVVWQLMQPKLFASASMIVCLAGAGGWPLEADCGAANANAAVNAETAEKTPRPQRKNQGGSVVPPLNAGTKDTGSSAVSASRSEEHTSELQSQS